MSMQTRNMLAQQQTFQPKNVQNENSRFVAKSKSQTGLSTRRTATALADKTNIMVQGPSVFNINIQKQTSKLEDENRMLVDHQPSFLNQHHIEENQSSMDICGSQEEENQQQQLWEDIDSTDHGDPQAVTAYVDQVYDNCRIKEVKYSVTTNYMSKQREISERMRYILIDWLIEVHQKFKLLPETLGLTVNLIDRFLERNSVSRETLQLVGITCMFIASKYEEIYPPECNDFVYISASAYSREQILEMESTVLNSLEFNLTAPTSLHFLRRFSKAARSDYTTHTLCKYFLEIAMVDMRMIQYYPSMIAAASVYLARVCNFNTPDWNPTLVHYTQYEIDAVHGCAMDLLASLKDSKMGANQAVNRKYGSKKFSEVSKRSLPEHL